ncbi:hypothetical protein [Virgibacillus dakarensis]|uniref:hypothetical protein n=1 Tax=Virgibacillus dakarensis TaxID=1917889 RepID=UPI000B450306|nr:hypothetical protein [Virgibacillus dakarensis]
MNYLKYIEQYGQDVTDFEVNPLETMDMLHLRSRLNKESHNMTLKERILLMKYDLQLLENVDRMVQHVERIYDFSSSMEPYEEWWWHLDQVASGELEVEIEATPKDKAL